MNSDKLTTMRRRARDIVDAADAFSALIDLGPKAYGHEEQWKSAVYSRFRILENRMTSIRAAIGAPPSTVEVLSHD